VLLVLMMLACIALSWPGIDYQLPHLAHFDEVVYHSQYRAIIEGDERPEARRYYDAYPSVLMHAAALLPRFANEGESTVLEAELARASSDFVFIRRCIAVLAALIVPAVWLLARRFVSAGWAFFTAAIAATSVLYDCFATQGRPHAIITVAIVFAVVAAIDVARQGTLRASLVAGLAAGASTAILHSGVATLLPLAMAHALRYRRDGKRAVIGFGAALVPFAAIFLVSNPGLLSKLFAARSDADGGGAAFLLSHSVALGDFRGGGALAVLRAFAYYDPLLLVAAFATLAAGLVLAFRRKDGFRSVRGEVLVVLAFCVPYLAALVLFKDTHYRFALPLFPFAALLAVLGLRSLQRIGIALGGLLLVAQLACVIQVMRLHCAPDTYEQAATWLVQNADRHSARISISPWLELPLLRKYEALAAHGLESGEEVAQWLDHQRAIRGEALAESGWSIVDLPLRHASQRAAFHADPLSFLHALNADYVILDAFEGPQRPLMREILAATRVEGHLEARFTPQGPDAHPGHHLEPYAAVEQWSEDCFVLQMWGASALGDCIEIYRMPPNDTK
jgi:hypothetical protein